MSGRTIRFRTVVLVLLCVGSLLAAPATAVATPENPFGGDSTESSGDGIGDTLDGSSETDSANDSDDSTSDSGGTADSGEGDSGRTTDSSEDADSSTLSGGDSDDPEGDESDTADSGSDDRSTAEADEGSSGEETGPRSALATGVNTTVGTTTDASGAAAADSWSSLEGRTATLESSLGTGDSVSGVDWSALGDTAEPTLAVADGDEPSLDAQWYESSLPHRGQTTTDPSLSGTLAGVTGDVLTGVGTVVGVAAIDTSLPSPTTQSTAVGEPLAGPAEQSPAATGPTDAGTEAAGVALDVAGDGAGAPTPLDSSPASGFAVGLGGVAALVAVRQGLFSTTGTGLAANASALAATVMPALASRSSALDRLVRMLTAFRYSRYDDSDPLEHDARADVFEVVEETPGAYLSEVAKQADLPLSTARHHVRVLEREELLTGAKVRGKRRFYPAYTGDIELAAALNDESTAVVLDALSRLGGASVSELADELGRDPSTVTHHLQRLAEDDIVVREREGRAVINRLSAEARTALEPETEAAPRAEASGAVASD